jgi:hypothetical protein
MQAALRSYVTSGIAIVGVSAIAVTTIAASPRDVAVASPAVQLTASPFDAYETLFNHSLDNIQGLVALALKPPPPPSEIPFTLESLFTGLFDVSANIAAFQNEVSGLPGQVQNLEQITQLFLQAASARLQAGDVEGAFQIVLYATLSGVGSLVSVATYPLTLLGPAFEEVAPVFAEAILNAAVAPALSGVVTGSEIALDALNALKAGSPGDILGDLIAAPAVVTDGVLNGTKLETGVFGPVDIPGILTDKTLQDAEGPGPISLAIQLVQIGRTLLNPSAATALSPNTAQETDALKPFDLDVSQGDPRRGLASTLTADADDKGDVLDADKVTNAGSDPAKTKNDRPRLFTEKSTGQSNRSNAAKNVRDGIHDGIQGLRDGVRNVVKSVTGRSTDHDSGDNATGGS